MPTKIHPIAGAIGFLTIATFWLSTVFTELFGSHTAVATLKGAIPWGFLILVPALAAAGASGMKLAPGARTGLAGAKAKRMPFIAGNGLLILIPSALYLAAKAKAGEFDGGFYVVQALELLAGATNLTLLGLNMRDGLKLSGRMGGAAVRETRFLGRDVVADGTMAFRFAKPAGFSYVAGQNVTLALPATAQTDAGNRARTLTLASAPGDDDLMVATRISDSAFKRSLVALPPGAAVTVIGPKGDMTLHVDAARPAVFLAGGVGVTPFLAMARDAARRKLAHRITLFYANRQADSAAFLDELRALEGANPNFKLAATMTGAAQGWAGETGRVDAAMLRRHLPDLSTPIFYVAGPPAMTDAMVDMLKAAGIAPQNIRNEAFHGYGSAR